MPEIRVKIGKDSPTVRVAVDGPWGLVGAEGNVASGESLDGADVRADGRNLVVDGIATTDGPVELRGKKAGSLAVQVAGRPQRRYRGSLRLLPVEGGRVGVVNVLPMESYLAGVLAKELYASWHIEAYEAQVVAARTYALRAHNRRSRYAFDVYDTPMSQVYGGMDAETQKAWQAVRATEGIVATYEEGGRRRLLPCYYHSTCGGDTVPAGLVFGGKTPPPLRGGTKCTYCRDASRYRWTKDVVLTKAEIRAGLARSGYPALEQLGPLARIEVAARAGQDGRATRIRVVDAAGRSVLVRAGDWRIWVGAAKVPSTWFWIEDRASKIALTKGRGFGHGVGLCQYGAQFLATHGQTGEQILRYYYPGVKLVRAY